MRHITTLDLKCEYAVDPLGIDVRRPRLSWTLNHPRRGEAQTAFQILAASAPDLLSEEAADLWDTGKVSSPHSMAGYAGVPLASRAHCCWTVRAWDAQGQPGPYAPPAWFEMGLLQPADWQGAWLGDPGGAPGVPVYFRKTFQVSAPVARARVYICGLGLYELYLNGQKVGDHVLDPAQTAYAKTDLYVTYDVGALLKPGQNALGVIVGAGWYGAPKLLCQLEIEYADHTRAVVYSGCDFLSDAWRVAHGPIHASGIFDGEYYDARDELPGWSEAGADLSPAWRAAVWRTASVVDGPGGRLKAQMMEPIRVVQDIQPVALSQPRPGLAVFDFGQNFAGWARLCASGPRGERGTQVTLRYAETLRADGTVNQDNLRGAKATDVYILKGADLETWEPRFTYHGFRYVQVEGLPGQPRLETLLGRVVRSAVEPTCQFSCSDDLLNRIQQMVEWTEGSNLVGLPTDCPQRDERMGWLNDMGARTEQALLNFDLTRLYAKWTGDIADAQDPRSGAISDTAPFHWGCRPADPVSVAYLLVPWQLFMLRGDARTLAEYYDGMKAWVDYLTRQAQDHILSDSYYGDWAPPIAEGLNGSPVSRDTPGALVSTAFYYYTVLLLYEFAGILGKSADKEFYADLFDQIAAAFNNAFWDEAAGGYGSNNQACNALALYMDLVPAQRKDRVVASLVRDVLELHQGHLTTGNLCTKYLLEALTAAGRADVAYTIAAQQTYPSWGFMLANGATTLWERWEMATGGGMNSHNHPMLGSVSAWIIKAMGGITADTNPDYPAFERFSVHPHPIGGLTWAKLSLKTVRGPVETAWQIAPGGAFSLTASVPVGSRAAISLPCPAGSDAVTLAENGVTIWQSGHSLRLPEGILEVRQDGSTLLVTAGSGAYAFNLLVG